MKLRKNKIIITTGALAVLTFGAFFLANSTMQLQTEHTVKANAITSLQKANTETESSYNIAEDASIKASSEYAKYLLDNYSSLPLLNENAVSEYGINSLETALNDVNATYSAKEYIVKICKDYKIDPDTAVIHDLTLEQITEIDLKLYENSEHPKN